jgi:hypothetical protein
MKTLFFLSIISVLLRDVHGQTNQGTLNLQVAFPQGAYNETYPVISSGLLFSITHRSKTRAPFSIGGELGILQVSGSDKYFTGVYNNEYNTFLVASWSHIITLAGLLKVDLLSTKKSWNAYGTFTVGTNIFLTATTISRDLYVNPIANLVKTKYYYSDTHWACNLRAGAGLGIEIPFGKQKKIAALVKCSYLYGSPAKYYARTEINNTQIILSPRFSQTTMLLAEAGIRFGIFNKKRHHT